MQKGVKFDRMPTLIREAHKVSSYHSFLVENSSRCWCFYCSQGSTPAEISEWTDNGHTAICPHCHVDALLPDCVGYPLSPVFLKEMYQWWFNTFDEDDADGRVVDPVPVSPENKGHNG